LASRYAGTDRAYAKLVDKLAEKKFAGVPPQLRSNILDYYTEHKEPASPATKKVRADWAKLQAQITQLRAETATAQ